MAADISNPQKHVKPPNAKTKDFHSDIKKCKYGDTCRFQTKGMYKHAEKESSNSLTEDILALKEKISKRGK